MTISNVTTVSIEELLRAAILNLDEAITTLGVLSDRCYLYQANRRRTDYLGLGIRLAVDLDHLKMALDQLLKI